MGGLGRRMPLWEGDSRALQPMPAPAVAVAIASFDLKDNAETLLLAKFYLPHKPRWFGRAAADGLSRSSHINASTYCLMRTSLITSMTPVALCPYKAVCPGRLGRSPILLDLEQLILAKPYCQLYVRRIGSA